MSGPREQHPPEREEPPALPGSLGALRSLPGGRSYGPVADPEPDPVQRRTRDLIAVGLLVLGCCGLLASLWFVHPLAACAAASLVVVGVGVLIGMG